MDDGLIDASRGIFVCRDLGHWHWLKLVFSFQSFKSIRYVSVFSQMKGWFMMVTQRITWQGREGLFGSILYNGKAISKGLETSFCSLATFSLLGLKGVLLIKLCYGSFDVRSEKCSFVVDERRIIWHQKERGEKLKERFPVRRWTKKDCWWFRSNCTIPHRQRKKKQRSDNEYGVGKITWKRSSYQ